MLLYRHFSKTYCRKRTLSSWLAEYRELTTYARLRSHALTLFTPHTLIRSTRLHHKQVYTYRLHQGKLALILAEKQHEAFSPVADYLNDMATSCPHALFQEEHRASQAANAFDLAGVEIGEKQNLAPRIAHLALQAVTHNKRRHDELQRFMLTTDSVTVAVEVPIYLTPKDITHMQQHLGFHIPITTAHTITGHIDVLQIRNGRVHILDYKPGAIHERPIAQLMVYALALSRRTGLRLFDFTCAWFDDRHYFEFYPLHVVHKRRSQRRYRG
jgi:ATP-dependent exoDNAse (exonuclease V) beta subunit